MRMKATWPTSNAWYWPVLICLTGFSYALTVVRSWYASDMVIQGRALGAVVWS